MTSLRCAFAELTNHHSLFQRQRKTYLNSFQDFDEEFNAN